MKHHTYTFVATSVALLFASAPVASAVMNVGANGDVEVKTTAMPMQVNMGAQESAALAPKVTLTPAQMDALMKAQAETRKKEGGNMMEEGQMEMDMKAAMDKDKGIENAKERADEHALDALEKAELHMDFEGMKDDQDAHDAHHGTSAEVEIDTVEKVRSSREFERFVGHKSKEDAHLKRVEIKDGKVDVDYEESAKLFGFMNTTVNAHVSVDAAGNVVVAYPWYHIFMKKTHSSASLQSEIARAIAGERKGEKEGIASTTMKATIATALGIPHIFDIIASTLKNVSVQSESGATVAE